MGTVFKLTPGGVLTTLVEFTGPRAATKAASLSRLGAGQRWKLLRDDPGGRRERLGTVFKLTPGGVLTTLVEFTGTTGSNKGSCPCAGLVQGSDGNFYGTTY